jgi:hypothetical protein
MKSENNCAERRWKGKTMPIRRGGSIDDALSNYLEAAKSKTALVGPLEKYLLLNPAPNDRPTDVLHPSETVSDWWCPRYAQMVIEGIIPVKEEKHRMRMQSIFAEGHAIHDKWQTWLGSMGTLYGIWRCEACGKKAWSLGRPSDLCSHSASCIKYDEVPLTDGLWSGHADGIVDLPGRPHASLLEIKSVGTGTIRWGNASLLDGNDLSAAFGRIAQPFDNHIRQIQIYMELAHRMYKGGDPEIPLIDSCVVIYECKSDQAVKEFVVQRDSSYIVDILEYADEMATLVGTGEYIACPFRECKHDHD